MPPFDKTSIGVVKRLSLTCHVGKEMRNVEGKV